MWYSHIADIGLKRSFSDFIAIRKLEPWIWNENEEFLKNTENELSLSNGAIVVTHHVPSYKGVHPRFMLKEEDRVYNKFFVCDVENMIVKYQPKMWLHGHTHDSYDYKIGETRVICNPLGYKYESRFGKLFEDKIVEI